MQTSLLNSHGAEEKSTFFYKVFLSADKLFHLKIIHGNQCEVIILSQLMCDELNFY
jgi:hypothetical protein